MNNSQNWRTEIDATDYFTHQKKSDAIDQRRPSIRKASDLVGPGIGAGAVSLDDYNDLLATFNGYYSSAVGALNAPNATEAFIGQVVSDPVLGGRQTFTGLTSGTEYTRTFVRSPVDPESLGWGLWSGQRIPPSVATTSVSSIVVPKDIELLLDPPNIKTIGDSDVYERTVSGILIHRQGVYTGTIQVGANSIADVADIAVYRPNGDETTAIAHISQDIGHAPYYPFTVWATDDKQAFSVSASHSLSGTHTFWWRFQCTRVGDAV